MLFLLCMVSVAYTINLPARLLCQSTHVFFIIHRQVLLIYSFISFSSTQLNFFPLYILFPHCSALYSSRLMISAGRIVMYVCTKVCYPVRICSIFAFQYRLLFAGAYFSSQFFSSFFSRPDIRFNCCQSRSTTTTTTRKQHTVWQEIEMGGKLAMGGISVPSQADGKHVGKPPRRVQRAEMREETFF